jgi:predicted DsbA family dithiol-disulfide isomerase
MRWFDRAFDRFEHADEAGVAWRGFQLELEMPPDTREPEYERLAAKPGGTIALARAMTGQVKAIAAGEGWRTTSTGSRRGTSTRTGSPT